MSPSIENLLKVQATDHRKIQEEIQENLRKLGYEVKLEKKIIFYIFFQRFLWPFPYRGWLGERDDILPGDIAEDQEAHTRHYQLSRLLLKELRWECCRISRVLKECEC